ncbi:MAG: ABC transporter ATP-binding protein, partial [Agathobacter sp.]|nr:ABC transporter ATP-binding protein [Agathobacter sp.]
IARGLNKDADIIILDEPTSALDPLVEYDILKKFIELTEGKTSVIISHRVGLCRFADRIIVMQNGRIAGNGTHEELLGNNAEYGRIWSEQARWYAG